MIWRVLVCVDVLTVASYAYRERGEVAAYAVIAGMFAVLLPLGAIERRLAAIAEGLPKPQPCAYRNKKL